MKILNIIGTVVGLIALAMAWVWFGWKLSLVIFLALMGNNFERSGKK